MLPVTAAILLIFTLAAGVFAQTRPSLTTLQRAGSFMLRTKPTKEQKKRLQPSESDLSRYAEFLRQPRTGIFRLMPDLGCNDNANVVRADAACLAVIPESSWYSFREKEHTIGMLSDIRLRNGNLITDGLLAQGILVRLGDVDLEKVALSGDGLEFLSEFTPLAPGLDAQKQYFALLGGVKVGKYEFRKSVPAAENTTYALRVVAYKGNVYRSFRGFRFDLLDGDKRVDLTIAFRVVRHESDGSATLVWKEVARRESPRIIYPKRPKRQKV